MKIPASSRMFSAIFCVILIPLYCCTEAETVEMSGDDTVLLKPTVMVSVLVRNKAHSLPYFLNYLEKLDYPKDRMMLWFRSDHNRDNSSDIVKKWIMHVEDEYHDVDYEYDDTQRDYPDQRGPCHWTDERFLTVISHRQEALVAARRLWADYLLMIDADNILLNNQTLKVLVAQDKTVVAPMLNATASQYYSNFWYGMDERGYYKRTEEYVPTLQRHRQGCFQVPMVHSTLLINLHHAGSRHLAYDPAPLDYKGPLDDIIIFAHNARYHGVPLHILNEDFYGYLLVPMEAHNTVEEEGMQFTHVKVEAIIYTEPLQPSPYIPVYDKPKDKLGFDEIYLINLGRRPDRYNKMIDCFNELGIDYKLFEAIDGQQLNDSYLEKMKIKMLPQFSDPYKGRGLTMGEIGCFLSHYFIWEEVVRKKYTRVLLFEDDIRFEPYFRRKIQILMYEVNKFLADWDLIYLGRKKLKHQEENWVTGADTLVWASYSYWTLSYILSYQGAVKLLDQKPLEKMVPVDEYLPIMFDRHPEIDWKEPFHPRDLQCLSVEPLLVYPTHYTGEPGYFTDTEDSEEIPYPVRQQQQRGDPDLDLPQDNRENIKVPSPSQHKHEDL